MEQMVISDKILGLFCGTENYWNSVPNHFFSAEEKTTGNYSTFCGTKIEANSWNSIPYKLRCGQIILLSYFGCFVKQIFPAAFCFIPSFGSGSSAELRMSQNEHLPRNIGNRSKSIPQNFFGTKFRG
jgi:hypothetical protein